MHLKINFIQLNQLEQEKRERGAPKVIFKKNKSKWKIFMKAIYNTEKSLKIVINFENKILGY